MSLYDEADDGHLAKLDEAEGRELPDINVLQDRLKTRRRWRPDEDEEARLEWERQQEEESPEAEWKRHQYRMRLRAADMPEVHYASRPGVDRRLFDVDGTRSL